MKTNFEKVSGRWIIKTGKRVVIGVFNYGHEIGEAIYADEVIDVCTGEHFGIQMQDFPFEWDYVNHPVYKFFPVFDYGNKYKRVKHDKKYYRRMRIDNMTGTCWDQYGFKKLGKTRFLRRRMHPNVKQMAEYESYFPFF